MKFQAIFLILLMLVGCKNSPNVAEKAAAPIGFSSSGSTYAVNRKWTGGADAPYGNQSHQFQVTYSTVNGSKEVMTKARIQEFRAEDWEKKDSKHLKQITPKVNQLVLYRPSDINGPIDDWKFENGNVAGYTGMMVAFAIGRSSIGIADCIVPGSGVDVGGTWTPQSIPRVFSPVGRSSFDEKLGEHQYILQLVSEDKAAKTLRIGFKMDASRSLKYYRDLVNQSDVQSESEKYQAEGFWIIHTATNQVLEFQSQETMTSNAESLEKKSFTNTKATLKLPK